MSGRLLVIDGLDGSGKATQMALLQERLAGEGVTLRALSFPNYESPSSALIKMYLAGEFGQNPGDVNAYAASAFYAVDRYAGYKKDWGGFYENGGLLLADRYATSNLIHQCAKLPEGEWEAYATWMEAFEYEQLGIPRPDRVLYLDVEPGVSQKLLQKRYGNAEKRDIHEKDEEYLARCRAAALWCAGRQGWLRIPCSHKGAMRTPGDIHEELYQLAKEIVWNSEI